MASRRQRNIQELNELLGKDKYKRTPAKTQKAADRRQRDQELKAEYIRKMYKKNTNKKAGGKVGSKNNAKKGGAPHNRLY
jgi:hypothetical protein